MAGSPDPGAGFDDATSLLAGIEQPFWDPSQRKWDDFFAPVPS
jgi:hypothetical protein